MVTSKRIVGIAVILTLLLTNALFIGQAVAVADDLPLGEGGGPLPPPPQGEYVPDQIIVKFKAGVLDAEIEQLNQDLETKVIYTSPFAGFKVLQILEGKTVAEMVEAYSRHPFVENAQPNYLYYATWSPNDPGYSLQWHFDSISLETAWDLDTTAPLYGGDPNIIVAVVDSGVAYETYGGYVQAPDLANTNFTSGWDFVNNDAHPNDDQGHGTHVCGTIAQSTNNGVGVAGIAFNTTIMPVKVMEPVWVYSGGWIWTATGTTPHVADGINYATANGADIINLSLGSSSPDAMLENAVRYAYNAGVVVIASSGNSGDTTPNYPASYDDYVISVGATRYDNARSPYSSYGSHLDMVAPGGDTNVDQNGDSYIDGVLQLTLTEPTYPNSVDPSSFTYYFRQGTSMACPHVAGVTALILAKHPSWTPDQVRNALETTATDLGTAGWDQYYGWGLLNAHAAVGATAVSPPTVTNYIGASDITYSGARLNGQVTATGGENPTVHIYWGDNNGGTTPGNWDNDVNLGTKSVGAFYTDIISLSPNTTYYYRCSATNASGTDWADSTETFQTLAGANAKLVGADDAGYSGRASPNWLYLVRFQAGETGNLTNFRLKAYTSGHVKVAIYRDNDGEPDTRLSYIDTSTAVSVGWNNIATESTPVIQGDYYWLAFNSDAYIVCRTSGLEYRCKNLDYATFSFPEAAGAGLETSYAGKGMQIAGWGIVTG
jgi:serine protease